MFGLLGALNLGEQVTVTGFFVLVALYIIRGKSLIGTIIGVVGTAATVALGVLGVLALSVALGWFDPQPGVFIEHAAAAIQFGIEVGRDVVVDFAMEAVT
jgi:hypothetical protein